MCSRVADPRPEHIERITYLLPGPADLDLRHCHPAEPRQCSTCPEESAFARGRRRQQPNGARHQTGEHNPTIGPSSVATCSFCNVLTVSRDRRAVNRYLLSPGQARDLGPPSPVARPALRSDSPWSHRSSMSNTRRRQATSPSALPLGRDRARFSSGSLGLLSARCHERAETAVW